MQTLILQDFHHTCLKIRSDGTDKEHLPWHLSGHDTLAVLAWQRDYWASDRGILVVLSVANANSDSAILLYLCQGLQFVGGESERWLEEEFININTFLYHNF